jgi:hypothetical protein
MLLFYEIRVWKTNTLDGTWVYSWNECLLSAYHLLATYCEDAYEPCQ